MNDLFFKRPNGNHEIHILQKNEPPEMNLIHPLKHDSFQQHEQNKSVDNEFEIQKILNLTFTFGN